MAKRRNHEDEFEMLSMMPERHEEEVSPIIELNVEEGFRESDPQRVLAAIPKVIEVNEFDDESVKDFQKGMAAAMRNDQQIIPVVIDSYGGELYALFRMLDIIEVAKQRGHGVATIATGKAMSCGACLLAAGTDGLRYATPESTIMIHEASSWLIGKASEIEIDAELLKAQEARLYALLDDACKKDRGYWEQRIHENKHANLYLTPREAQKAGLIAGIGLPTFRVSARISYEWIKP